MAQTDRHLKLVRWLQNGFCSRSRALRELEVSRATLNRDIAFLRARWDMPIDWDREREGWTRGRRSEQQYEVPFLSFNPDEMHALLTMQHLLTSLDAGGLLGAHIEPLRRKLHRMLGSGDAPAAEIVKRIRLRIAGARRMEVPHFQAVGSALLRRKRLVLHYRARSGSNAQGEAPLPPDAARELSPQRLLHYRSNWFLVAWCHTRRALRSFSIDAVERVQVLDVAAIEIPDGQLDDVFETAYGIFAGPRVHEARLRFSAERSRWVAAEHWHPNQRGRFDNEGRWVLTLPFSDMRELVMDVLRHVPEVEVLWPEELEAELHRRLSLGLAAAASPARPGTLDE